MHKNNISIVVANTTHINGICSVLTESITVLCRADHHNETDTLAAWLSNKTPDNIKKWLENRSNYTIVALSGTEEVVGVAMISDSGAILLNYVHPEYTHQGIGKSLLNTVESFATQMHLNKITVSSTVTALLFYKTHGFKEEVTDQTREKNDGVLLAKALRAVDVQSEIS